jgi:hypothetical protein
VFTNHVIGLSFDWIYQSRLRIEKYGPKIVDIKGIYKTIADSISRLEYDASVNQAAESYFMIKVKNSKCSQRQNWMTVSKY